jgi:hypothetical protein
MARLFETLRPWQPARQVNAVVSPVVGQGLQLPLPCEHRGMARAAGWDAAVIATVGKDQGAAG